MVWLGVTQGHQQTENNAIRHSVDACKFLLALNRFWDIGQKLPIWAYSTSIWRPRWGWFRWNFAEIFGIRKLESLGYRMTLLMWS